MLTQLIKKATNAVSSAITSGQATSFEDRIEEFGNMHWNDLKSAYIVYHQLVWDSLLKYSGVLWTQWNNQTKTYDVVDQQDEWTPTPEINRFAPAIDAMLSNFSTVPEVEAVPNRTDDVTAFAISDIATKIAQWIMKVNALHQDFQGDENKAGRAGALLVLAGTVFTRTVGTEEQVGEKPVMEMVPSVTVRCAQCDTYENIPQDEAQQYLAESGGSIPVCPTCSGQYEIGEGQVQRETGQTEPIIQHGVKISIGDPLAMLPRPGALHMNHLGYAIWAERKSLDEIWEQWGIEAQPDQVHLDGYSSSYDNVLQYYYTGSSASMIRNKEEAMVVELFIEPGKVKAIPEGAYAVMINGRWHVRQQWEFVEHPLTKANYKNQPKLFFGRTDAFDLAKLQKETNHYEAIIKLHGMTSSMDPILQDENTQVDEITNRGDRVIKYRSLGPGSQPPTRLQHGTLDNGIYVQRDKLATEFQNTSGAVNVWRGEAPGSITAASAISQLRGQAEMMFNNPEGNWKALWVETVRKAVKICQATMEPWEIAEIIGEGKDVEITAFKGADLDKLLNWVSTKAGLPKTKDERRQEMLMLWDRGALDLSDVHVKERVVELFGDTGMLQNFNKDATRARLENEQIKQGLLQPVVMVGIEDLEVHYAIHVDQIKSLDFDKWPPEAKEALIAHALETKDVLDMAMEVEPPPSDQNGGEGAEGEAAGSTSSAGGGKGKQSKGGKNGGGSRGRNRKDRPVPASSNGKTQVPTGPNGPGSSQIPGGNR